MKCGRIFAVAMTALLTVSTLTNDYLVANAEDYNEIQADSAEPETADPEETVVYDSDDGYDLDIVDDSEPDTEDGESVIQEEQDEVITDAEEITDAGEGVLAEDAEKPKESGEETAAEYPALEEETIAVEDMNLEVSIEAPEGAFPEGTQVSITEKTVASETEDAIKGQAEEDGYEVSDLMAVDISFIYEGEEIEPAEGSDVRVSFVSSDMEGSLARVYHVDDEDASDIDLMGAQTSEDSDRVNIESSEFSVYVCALVTKEDEDTGYQITYHFDHPDADGSVASDENTITGSTAVTDTKSVKLSDGSEYGSLTAGYILKGWSLTTGTTEKSSGANTDFKLGATVDLSGADWKDTTVENKNIKNLDLYAVWSAGTEMTEASGYIKDSSVIKINGQKVGGGDTITVNNGDPIYIELNWTIPNNDEGVSSGDSFYYDFPQGIIFVKDGEEINGDLTDADGNKVGTAELININEGTSSQYSRLILTYTDEDFLMNGDIEGSFTLIGSLDISQIITGGSKKVEFSFPGIGTVTGTLTDEKKLTVTKNVNSDKKGFTISVESQGTNTNVTVTDTMGKYIRFPEGFSASGLTLYSDEACTAISALNKSAEKTLTTGNDGFTIVIPQMEDGQKFYINYPAELTGDTFTLYNSGDSDRKNTVKASSTEITTPSTAEAVLGFAKEDVLKKNVSFEYDTDNGVEDTTKATLTWTVNLNVDSSDAGTPDETTGTVPVTLTDSMYKIYNQMLNPDYDLGTDASSRINSPWISKVVYTPGTEWTIYKAVKSGSGFVKGDEVTKLSNINWASSATSSYGDTTLYTAAATVDLVPGQDYIIEYSTRVTNIPAYGGVTIKNQISASTSSAGSVTAEAQQTLGNYPAYYADNTVISKTNSSGNKVNDDGSITWNIKAIVLDDYLILNNDNITIEDWYMDLENSYIDGTKSTAYGKLELAKKDDSTYDMTVTVRDSSNNATLATLIQGEDYTIDTDSYIDDTGVRSNKTKLFRLNISYNDKIKAYTDSNGTTHNKIIYITYKTKAAVTDKKTDVTFRNWAAVHFGNYDYEWTDYEDVSCIGSGLSKSADSSRTDRSGNLGWTITTVDLKNMAGRNAYIKDTLPQNNTYLEGSMIVTAGSKTYSDPSSLVTVNTDGTFNIALPDSLISWADGSEIKFSYQTQVDAAKLSGNVSAEVSYTNKASLVVSNAIYATVTATQSSSLTNIMSKEMTYEGGTEIIYEVNVNPDGLDLISEEDGTAGYLELYDSMGSAITLKEGSVMVSDSTGATRALKKLAADAKGEGYKVDPSDETGHTLIFYLPDGQALTLMYTAVISADRMGDKLGADAQNSIKLTGSKYSGFEKTTTFTGIATNVTASTSGTYKNLEIVKKDKDSGAVLSGATFGLYKVSQTDGTRKVLYSGLVTGDQGDALVNYLRPDVVYCVVEEKAPTGYELNSTPVFFVYKGHNGTDYAETITYDGTEYPLTVVEGNIKTHEITIEDKIIVIPPDDNPPDDPPSDEETTDDTITVVVTGGGVLGARRGIEADTASVLGARRINREAAVLGARRDMNTSDSNNMALYLMMMGVSAGAGGAYAVGRRKKHEA